MSIIDKLAERYIIKAMEQGEFDDLPGQGKPLNLDDDRDVPEHLRASYRLLKNAGYLPPELELRKEIQNVEQLINQAQCEGEKRRQTKRLRYLITRLNLMGRTSTNLHTKKAYYDKLQAKLDDEQ